MFTSFIRYLKRQKLLIHGDPLVLDRWLWICKWLPKTNEDLSILDVGCGSGAFTINAAARGYKALGLSWDKKTMDKADARSRKLLAKNKANFIVQDCRTLDKFKPEIKYDFVLNTENIEHILNDEKLFYDLSTKVKPGGYLLLTTPFYFYKPITDGDKGPFQINENGGHVRRGYSESHLKWLCKKNNLSIENIGGCSGLFSILLTRLIRSLNQYLNPKLSWLIIMPLRLLPILFDPFILKYKIFPRYSITLVAWKPPE